MRVGTTPSTSIVGFDKISINPDIYGSVASCRSGRSCDDPPTITPYRPEPAASHSTSPTSPTSPRRLSADPDPPAPWPRSIPPAPGSTRVPPFKRFGGSPAAAGSAAYTSSSAISVPARALVLRIVKETRSNLPLSTSASYTRNAYTRAHTRTETAPASSPRHTAHTPPSTPRCSTSERAAAPVAIRLMKFEMSPPIASSSAPSSAVALPAPDAADRRRSADSLPP
jgi:hypothetical protein